MKFYIASENRHIDIDQAVTINDIQYPAGYLRSITPAERAAMGLQEVVEVGIRESQETHFVTEELVGAELLITSIPKPPPTKKEKLKKAADAYNEDLAAFQEQYLPALFSGNTTGADAIKSEAATRKANYLAELTKIRSGEL